MTEFLLTMAGIVLVFMAMGLARVLRGPAEADRMMGAQLLGTNTVALLLLLATAVPGAGFVDAAIILTLLAAFSVTAFVSSQPEIDSVTPLPSDQR